MYNVGVGVGVGVGVVVVGGGGGGTLLFSLQFQRIKLSPLCF